MKTNTEVMSGVVRSLKKAAERHDKGQITDFDYINAVIMATDRYITGIPAGSLTEADTAAYTNTKSPEPA